MPPLEIEMEQLLKKYVDRFNRNDEETVRQYIDNNHAYEFLCGNIPLFECSDSTVEEIYYFRWWVFRKHIKKTPCGFIITEFHPDVPWAGPFNSINCAAGHHISEGRWLREGQAFISDYIMFWFKGQGNVYSYSSPIIDSVYEYGVIHRKNDMLKGLLDHFVNFYSTIEKTNMTRYGLFWSYDDRDAMEMSISGSGLRPTLNSYMYANASAIAKIAKKTGRADIADVFEKKAEALKSKMHEILWDREEEFFKVVPQNKREDEIPQAGLINRMIKEEIGYIPFAYGIPPTEMNSAFRYLMDGSVFMAPYGITTADRSHADYNKPCPTHECIWNGPVWPFATTQTLNSVIAVLHADTQQDSVIQKPDFMKLLESYAAIHYRKREDGRTVNWLDENIDGESGEWLSRNILKGWDWPEKKGGYERGKDYNHSAFCDLIIRGIAGVVLTEDDNLVIDSLLPDGYYEYFRIGMLPYKNHSITVQYDRTGSKYGKQGLNVYIDGKLQVGRSRIEKITIPLER